MQKSEGAVDHNLVSWWLKEFRLDYKNFDNQAWLGKLKASILRLGPKW